MLKEQFGEAIKKLVESCCKVLMSFNMVICIFATDTLL